MSRRCLIALTLLLAPMAAQAQSGTTVWSMRMQMPDSLSAKAGGLSEIDMRMTLATDGSRLGMQIDFAQSMSTAMPNFDLSAVRVNAVVHPGGDSVSVGMVLPPEMAAMTGGGIGFRIDMAVPDSVKQLARADVDSIMREEKPTVTNTGRTAVVAGITCEEWEVTPVNSSDTLPFTAGPMKMCVAENVPGLKPFTSLVEEYLPDFGFDLSEMRKMTREWFGGRDMTTIRMIMGTEGDIVVQLESSATTAPDPSFFVLPDGLQQFPIEMFKAMIPTDQGT